MTAWLDSLSHEDRQAVAQELLVLQHDGVIESGLLEVAATGFARRASPAFLRGLARDFDAVFELLSHHFRSSKAAPEAIEAALQTFVRPAIDACSDLLGRAAQMFDEADPEPLVQSVLKAMRDAPPEAKIAYIFKEKSDGRAN